MLLSLTSLAWQAVSDDRVGAHRLEVAVDHGDAGGDENENNVNTAKRTSCEQSGLSLFLSIFLSFYFLLQGKGSKAAGRRAISLSIYRPINQPTDPAQSQPLHNVHKLVQRPHRLHTSRNLHPGLPLVHIGNQHRLTCSRALGCTLLVFTLHLRFSRQPRVRKSERGFGRVENPGLGLRLQIQGVEELRDRGGETLRWYVGDARFQCVGVEGGLVFGEKGVHGCEGGIALLLR